MERRYLVDSSQTAKERKWLEARNQEFDGMFLSLHTDKDKGLLTEQRFLKLTAALEQEQKTSQKRLHDLSMRQSRAGAQKSHDRTFIKEIRCYTTIEELDESVLNRFISKILIGEVKKVDGQKVQKVRIMYNFVGEIPEIAAQTVCPISQPLRDGAFVVDKAICLNDSIIPYNPFAVLLPDCISRFSCHPGNMPVRQSQKVTR